MSVDLYDHPTERAVLTILGAESQLNVATARTLLEQCELVMADFHLPAHAELFHLAEAFLQEGRPVDLIGVTAAVKGNSRVPAKLVTEIFSGVPASESALPGYSKTLRELAVKRQMLGIVNTLREELVRPGTDVDAMLGRVSSEFAALNTGRRGYKTGLEAAAELYREVERNYLGQTTRCILTGVDLWDQYFGGLETEHLTLIGGQPSVGKGQLFGTFVDNLSHVGVRCGIFSMEDKAPWLPRRQAAREAAIPNHVLAKKRLTDGQFDRFKNAMGAMKAHSFNYFIDDRRGLTPSQVEQQARHWCVNHGVRVILLDHFGKVNWDADGKFGARFDLAIGAGMNRFAKVASDYGVAFVIAAHTKRPEWLKRDEDPKYVRPRLTDFALASWAERDARNAAGLYLSKDHPDCVVVADLKQTNGPGESHDFALKKLKGTALLCSENGAGEVAPDQDEEQLMLADWKPPKKEGGNG